jgi:hypothetical protein
MEMTVKRYRRIDETTYKQRQNADKTTETQYGHDDKRERIRQEKELPYPRYN